MVGRASFQNCTPGPITELNGWVINVYSFSQPMEESNYGHKGKNEKIGFILHMKKIRFIL